VSAVADDADRAAEAAATTPGDVKRDGAAVVGGASTDPPKRRGRPKGTKNKPKPDAAGAQSKLTEEETKELRKLKRQLTKLLRGPAMMLEPWPGEHVEAAAPDLASSIIAVAEEDAKLRRRLISFLEGGTMGGLIAAAVIYTLPVAMYYGAPAPALFRKAFQVPDRQLLIAQAQGKGPPPMPAEPPAEQLLAEANAAGFDDPEEYRRAVHAAVHQAVTSVRGPHDFPPARPAAAQ
jgi:hypothetical protein